MTTTHWMRTIAGLALWLAGCAMAAPPPAPSEPVTDTLHGVRVADPYRNLENLKSPQTQAWLKAQGEYGAELLSRIDGRDELARRIAELAKASGDSVRQVTRLPGERIYYLQRKAGESQFKLVMRIGLQGAERVLVDPQQLAQASGVPHAINYFVPSWDGRTLAYGISAGGSEDASLHLMDIASGKPLREPIPRVHEDYVQLDAGQPPPRLQPEPRAAARRAGDRDLPRHHRLPARPGTADGGAAGAVRPAGQPGR